MKALLLCGGLGTRLRPLTFSIPKPLLPVGRRAIIEFVLDYLAANGISSATLSLGYRGDLIRAYVSQLKSSVSLEFMQETGRLGTAGPILLAAGHLPSDEPFYVMNADIFTRLPLTNLLAAHIQAKADATVAARSYTWQSPYGVLRTDPNGWLEGIDEKPRLTQLISTGIYCFNPKVLEWITPNCVYDIPQMLATGLGRGGKVAVYEFEDDWRAIEELGELQQVNQHDWTELPDGDPWTSKLSCSKHGSHC